MPVDPNARTRLSETSPDPFCGRTIGGYRVEERIGAGGMGTVYKAVQLSLGRPVALKILPEDLARDRQFLDRFVREADVLCRLSHPNVVTVYDRGEIDGRPFLVLEYVEGTSLREVMRKGKMAAAEALRVVSSVLAALQHAHEKGVIHRDVKPENVLLSSGGVVKVADFGLSRLLGPVDTTRLTRTHLVLGTYEYMAPEQRERAGEADERSDLYATGVVLYEMLTGELPIGRFDVPSRRRSDVDGRLDAVVERSLEKDPARRFQRAREMNEAVSAILDRPAPQRKSTRDLAWEPPAPALDYRPARFEYHLDNVATIDHVLGTLCYVLALAGLFGVFRELEWGASVIGFFLLGWYLRETSDGLRKFKHSARTAQAVIALVAAATLVLLPFSVYSFWALYGHRGRAYFDARRRGLDPPAAARYAYRLLEEPYGPPQPPPPAPSQIAVESMVTSRVEPERRRSPFVTWGVGLLSAGVLAGGALAVSGTDVPQYALAAYGGVVAALLFAGLLHSLLWPRVTGAARAFFLLLLLLFLGAWVVRVEPEPARAPEELHQHGR